jgi:hydrogenase expression/formation protein HypE
VATTDPMSFIRDIGPKQSAFESVGLIASDLATSGFSPQFALFDLNLPLSMKSSDFRAYWEAVSLECKKLGIAIIGGHTSRFEGLNSTVIGAGTMFSFGPEDSYLTSQNGRVGDKILVTKGAAIAATAILASSFPNFLRKRIGKSSLAKSKAYVKSITTVKDSLVSAKAGAGALHDSTEGGVLSALYELASASKTGMLVDLANIPVSEETREICKAFKIDPYTSLSEGSLVISCKPSKVNRVISALLSSGIKAAVVGELTPSRKGIMALDGEGEKFPVRYPVTDPYWRAYYGGKKSGWT